MPERLPRKNDPASIDARREALGLDGVVTAADLAPYLRAAESVTGTAVLPVSVAQLLVSLGEYELSEDGEVVETGRRDDEVTVPLAHSEGGLTASLQRGARAVELAGGFRTYVVADRITRASCFVCRDAGDAVGPNMMTRNAYALNMAYVLPNAPVPIERALLEANMGGDKKPSFEFFQSGHGKTVIAEATLTDEALARVLRTTAADLDALSWAGTHGAVASGMQSVAFTPASAIAAIFAATGQDLGMVGTSSMAHGTGRRVEGGLHASIRFPGLEVGTVGGGTTLPTAREWLALLGCEGQGKVYRFAQIVAAAALALEISASAAMASAGSEHFFRAHFERGGTR